jgi:hypothetical protein
MMQVVKRSAQVLQSSIERVAERAVNGEREES